MAGIFGALAQKLAGREYSPTDPVRQIGDDIAAGVIVTNRDPARDAIESMFDAFGPAATMDILEGFGDNK